MNYWSSLPQVSLDTLTLVEEGQVRDRLITQLSTGVGNTINYGD